MPVAIPALLIALRLFMQVFAVWMLRLAYAVTLGLLLRLLASQAGRVPLIGGKLKKWLTGADMFVADALGKVAQANETVLSGFFHGLGVVVDQTNDTIVDLAKSMYVTFDAVIHGEIPNHAKRANQPIVARVKREADRSRAYDARTSKAIATTGKASVARTKAEARARQAAIARVEHTYTDVVVPDLRGIRTGLANLRGYTARQLRAANRRIGSLERALGAGAIAAIGLGVLSRAFPYWRCTNVRSFNRALCRAPVGALDDLLGLALLSVGSLSIVAFAEEVGELMDPAAEAIHRWIVEE